MDTETAEGIMDLRERAAGCLLCGAFFGERAVPRRFTERLELADLLKESAVALADEAERERGTV